jgi:DMSO/TMAO reductase YedYZ molybdopterin-dependent catalytic subunit
MTSNMHSRRTIFLRGAWAMAVALVVIFVVRNFFPVVAYPPEELRAWLVGLVPGDFATAMIERLGHLAIKFSAVAVNLGVVAAGGVVALWIHRGASQKAIARGSLTAAAGMVVVSLVLQTTSTGGWSLTAAVVFCLAAYAYAKMAGQVPLAAAFDKPAPEDGPLDEGAVQSRRSFLGKLAAGAIALTGGAVLFGSLTKSPGRNVKLKAAAAPFTPPPSEPAFPSVPGQTPEITSNDNFYNVDISVVKPVVDSDRWLLKVKGLVNKPLELTYNQLQSDFQVVEFPHTLSCISNEVGGDLISTAVWRGVGLADVLGAAGLKEGVVDIVFRAAEGYTDSIPVAKALEPTTRLAFGMNGVPLPREHGFPVRAIVPGIYGMKNVKWITEIEAVAGDYQGYWEKRGWSDVARVKTESRIDVPSDGAFVKAGGKIAGIAWAGDRGISKVEVSFDRGASWQDATLKRALGPTTWRLWVADLPASKGRKRILVRAVDGTGDVQTSTVSNPHPDGASGYDFADVTLE